jgi:hypothetical protein
VRVWPREPGGRVAGSLLLRLSVPAGERAQRVHIGSVGAVVRPGRAQRLVVPVCSRGPWSVAFESDARAIDRGRRVGPVASAPRFVADRSACP